MDMVSNQCPGLEWSKNIPSWALMGTPLFGLPMAFLAPRSLLLYTYVLVHTRVWKYELAGQLEHVTDKGVLGLFSSRASMSLKQAF